MRFLVRLLLLHFSRESSLATVRAIAKTTGAQARNPKWTSYGALEMDIFCPTRADFELFRSALEPLFKLEFARDLNVAPRHKSEDALFSEARSYFNSERYWECHEVLEGAWRMKEGEEKSFLQGVILLCAAFVHHQKGEDAVALGVLRRAVKQLEFPAPRYHGVGVAALRRNAEKVLASGIFSNFRV